MQNIDQTFDQYAAAALTGLLSKYPVIDKREDSEMNHIDSDERKIEIAKTALEYAGFMMMHRREILEDTIKALEYQNEEVKKQQRDNINPLFL